jgi:5-methylcytosine-specific restriction enzyme subunit McrC
MRRLTLREYWTERAVPLTTVERDALREVARVTVQPTPGTSDHYDVTPSSVVGALEVGELAVTIKPKIPVGQVMFLMSYALDPVRWQSSGFDFAELSALVEAIAPGFVRHVEHATRKGLLQGYRTEEAALTTLRGRIRVDDQLRRRHGIIPPIEVRYDEFTVDIEVNRLLKAAVAALRRLRLRSPSARVGLRALDSVLQPVSEVRYDRRRLPEIAWSRLNGHYRTAAELAKLIVASSSFELGHGGMRSSGFLVDMNRVFEDFAVVALREALGVGPEILRHGDSQLRLDLAGAVTLEPDLSWWDHGRCRFVVDLKYKRIGHRGGLHADLYQLLSYVLTADLPAGLLVYAAGEADEAIHEVVHVGRRLVVTTLDISGSSEEVLGRVRALADRIRSMLVQS